MTTAEPYVLLIDFCGSEPLLALMRGETLAAREPMPERGAAAGWLPALRQLLRAEGLQIQDLAAVGVVAGPGSFTGVRTGVAAAKGLCEAADLPLAAVSRLGVLAHAATDSDAVAVLHAGRGQVYVRIPADQENSAKEMLADIATLELVVHGRPVVIAEPALADELARFRPALLSLGPHQILPLVQQELLRRNGQFTADANYVRGEKDIYRKPIAAQMAEASR